MKKATSLRLSEDIFKKIKARAKVHRRNFSNQVEVKATMENKGSEKVIKKRSSSLHFTFT